MIKTTTRRPKEYLEQGLTQCGAYNAKAILSAFGKDTKSHPRDYQPSLFSRYTGMGSDPHIWPKVLQSYGVPAEEGCMSKMSDMERLALLKNLLSNNRPIMLRIGNGYAKSGNYHGIAANFIGHRISLWGFDDEKQIFYVYDPYVARNKHDKNIPIGNTARTFSEILRDWGKGFPFAWRHCFIAAG